MIGKSFLLLCFISCIFGWKEGNNTNTISIFIQESKGKDVEGCGSNEKNPCYSLSFAFQNILFNNLTINDTLQFKLSGNFLDSKTLNATLDVSSRKDYHGNRIWIGTNGNSAAHLHCSEYCLINLVSSSNQTQFLGGALFIIDSLSFNRVSVFSHSSSLNVIGSSFSDSRSSVQFNSSNVSPKDCNNQTSFLDFYSSSSSSLTITETSFNFACSNRSGGALRIQIQGNKEEVVTIRTSQFTNNRSTKEGGAFYLSSTSSSWDALSISQCKFLNNSASDGGAIAFKNGLVGNWTDNAILFNNANREETGEIACLENSDGRCSSCRMDYCNLCDGFGICATLVDSEIQYCYVKDGDEEQCGGSSHKEIGIIGGIFGGIFVVSIGFVLLSAWANNRKEDYVTLNDEPPWTRRDHSDAIAPKSFD